MKKINYKHPLNLKKSIDINFIENGLVVFESINFEWTNIYF